MNDQVEDGYSDATKTPEVPRDEDLIEIWLNGRPATTASAYRADAASMLTFLELPLRAIKLGDLQRFAASLGNLRPASQARRLSAIRSLLEFGHLQGWLPESAGRALRLPKLRDRLSERIITEAEVQRLLQLEPNARNNALFRVIYHGGLRISEACALRWRDLRGTKSGGVISVFGKGGKTRSILVQPKLWRTLSALRGEASPDHPVFPSGKGNPLNRSAVHRLVKAAARRAGLRDEVSTHWLRHAHASHASDHGCPLHELQASLGHASLETTSRYIHVRPDSGSAKYLPE